MKLLTTTEFAVGKNDIVWVNQIFKDRLYDISFIPEDTKLSMKKLPRAMNGEAILKELTPAPIKFGEILSFLKTSDHSLWYIFYVHDTEHTLWAVRASWGGGWNVDAVAVSDPREWVADGRVVSGDFSDTQHKTLGDFDALALDSVELDHEQRIVRIEAILSNFNLDV